MAKKRKSTKGALIKGMLEHVPITMLRMNPYNDEIKKTLENKSGLYILYRDDTPYYVGLGANVFWRILHHFKDRHKNHWNYISVFVSRKRNIKDLETLLINVLEPAGNKIKGTLPKEHRYTDLLKKLASEKEKEAKAFKKLLTHSH